MEPGRSLLVLEFPTLGKAYEAAQKIEAPLELVELIPGAEGGALLASGPKEILQDYSTRHGLKGELIDAVAASVLQSYLGLENPPLQGTLIVFESPSVAALFRAAQALSDKGLRPFDLRVQRGGKPRGHVLATGSVDQTADLVPLERRGTWTLIQSPSSALKSLFELNPK